MSAHLVLLLKKYETLIHPGDNQEGDDCITKVSQNINLPACKYFFMQCIARHDLSSNSCDSISWREATGIKIFEKLTLNLFLDSEKCLIRWLVTGGVPCMSCRIKKKTPQTIQQFEILTCPGGLAAPEKTILPCLKMMDFFQFVPGMDQMPPETRGKFHSSLACRTGYWWHCCSTSDKSCKLLHP